MRDDPLQKTLQAIDDPVTRVNVVSRGAARPVRDRRLFVPSPKQMSAAMPAGRFIVDESPREKFRRGLELLRRAVEATLRSKDRDIVSDEEFDATPPPARA